MPARSPPRDNGYAVALRWTALQPGHTGDALFAIDRAANWGEFRAAAADFDVPGQNLVYADAAGHIGYQAPGLIPIRRTGNGDWPVPGWDPAYEWTGYVPFKALSSVLDPKSGYVVTANQAVTKPDYPYFLGDSFDYGYRAQRIRDLLEARGNGGDPSSRLTVDDMASIQLDGFSLLARQLTPRLLAIKLPGGYYQQGQQLLRSWNFEQGADSAAAPGVDVP